MNHFFLLALVLCVLAESPIVYQVTDDSYEGLFSRHAEFITYLYVSSVIAWGPLLIFRSSGTKKVDPITKELLESLTSLSKVGAVNCQTDEDPCLDSGVSTKSCPRLAV
jgi:hypothetical protein